MYYLRCAFIFAIVSAQNTDLESLITSIFGSTPNDLVTSSNCLAIEGKLQGQTCVECYNCGHERIKDIRNMGKPVQKLKLQDANCTSTDEVCCVSQIDLTTRIGLECGTRNPDGVGPRVARMNPREQLVGEYPWNAYVYKISGNRFHLLCSATYINDGFMVFITTAKCVEGIPASQLAVSYLHHTSRTDLNVNRVQIHNNYDGTSKNNIAVLILSGLNSIPTWAKPACLPDAKVHNGAKCVTFADNSYIINTVIPLRNDCGNIHASQTCSELFPNDYTPAAGSGLFCMSEHDREPTFIAYGIAQTTKHDIAVYTELYDFKTWIKSTY